MNIIVVRSDGSWYTRPDTTVERERKDFFLPSRYESAEVVAGAYVRIIKAGKAIAAKYIDRYLDNLSGNAILIYGPDGMTCMDSSTILIPAESSMDDSTQKAFGKALCDFSSIMSVRIGDILILESEERRTLTRGDNIAQYISLR